MSDHQWGEIFCLTEELKRIEAEVDKRLEETLAEDPHVIESETVHLAESTEDLLDPFRMRQSLPTFGPIGLGQPGGGMESQPAPMRQASAPMGPEETAEGAQAPVDPVAAAAAAWNERPVEDYNALRSVEEMEDLVGEAAGDAQGMAPVTQDAATAGQGAASATQGSADEREATGKSNAEDESRVYDERDSASEIEAPDVTHTTQDGMADTQETTPAAPDVTQSAQDAMGATKDTAPIRRVVTGTSQDTASAVQGERSDAADVSKETAEAARKVNSPSAHNILSRKGTLAVLIVVIIILAVILGRWYYKEQVVPGRQYSTASELAASGAYDDAIAAYAEIRGYKDAAEQIAELEYAKATDYVDAGSYQDAVDYIDNLSDPTEEILTLRAGAVYQIALQYYREGDLGAAEGALIGIKDYETDDVSALDLLHEIQYLEVTQALAVYDYDTAEPILVALGDYEDAAFLLEQVRSAIDIVYTDVARDDNGKEINGKTQYLWVHSVITPSAVTGDTASVSAASSIEQLRELAGATDSVDDDAVHILMMHMDTTDAAMTYEDAEPIKTDKSTVVTKEISSYAAIDETFGSTQIVFDPQTLQRSNTDYALQFEGSSKYAAKDADSNEVRMECKMAEDGYWVKTRRVYAQMEDGELVGVPKSQLRTWTKVLNESLADEVRAGFLHGNASD